MRSIAASLALALVGTAGAQGATPLPHYKPQATVPEPIRIFGGELGGMVRIWEEGFANTTPRRASRIPFPPAMARPRV